MSFDLFEFHIKSDSSKKHLERSCTDKSNKHLTRMFSMKVLGTKESDRTRRRST